MRCETRQNTFCLNVGATPLEILGPNPSRKSFIISPVAGGTYSAPGYVSLSYRSDVAPGAGILNYITGATFPTIITDEDIGDSVGLPWWIVSTFAVCVTVCEYSYVYTRDCEGR